MWNRMTLYIFILLVLKFVGHVCEENCSSNNPACLISFALLKFPWGPFTQGLPIFSQSFNYSDPKWYYVAGNIARLAEFVQLAAVIAGSHYFYPLIVPQTGKIGRRS